MRRLITIGFLSQLYTCYPTPNMLWLADRPSIMKRPRKKSRSGTTGRRATSSGKNLHVNANPLRQFHGGTAALGKGPQNQAPLRKGDRDKGSGRPNRSEEWLMKIGREDLSQAMADGIRTVKLHVKMAKNRGRRMYYEI